MSTVRHLRQHFGTTHKKGPQISHICSGEAQIVPTSAIVLGHDRQPQSRDALNAAMDFADRLNASLHIVHTVSLGDYPIDPDIGGWQEYAQEKLAEEQAEVANALRDHAIGWSYYVGRGDPTQLLIRVAEEQNALMIIVGSRGEGMLASFGRLVEPAVSHRLIQSSQLPVLVVSHPREPLRFGRLFARNVGP